MRIEDRMSMWAAKRPRDEVAELLLEGAQEIADLRRHQEEDGEQMGALIAGYQKMQGLCIDGKYLTDEERAAVGYYIGTGAPDSVDASLGGLLERMRSDALPTCETVSRDGDYPTPDNEAHLDNARGKLRSQGDKVGSKLVQHTTHTLTDAEREAIEVAAQAYAGDHGERFAATLRALLERMA